MLTGRQQILEIPKEQRYASRPALSEVLAVNPQARSEVDQAIYYAHAVFGYTQKEVADFLGVHYATVSRAVKRVEQGVLDCKT